MPKGVSKYDGAFKKQIVEEMREKGLSYREIARQYEMCIRDRFNTVNILASISAGGLPRLLGGMPDNLASLPSLGLSLLFAALCILVNLTLFILYYQLGGMGQFGTLMRDVYKRQPFVYSCLGS